MFSFLLDEFNSALSKVTFPLRHHKIDLFKVEIGNKKQLTCLSQYNLDPYHQIVDDITKTLHNLLPIGNSNNLSERLNISCLLNLIHVKWLKVDSSNSLLSMNSNINDTNNHNNNASNHKLQCSTLYIIDINVTRSTDFGLYSCNIYFGEQLIYERYFRLMESVISSYSCKLFLSFLIIYYCILNNLHICQIVSFISFIHAKTRLLVDCYTSIYLKFVMILN